MKMSTFLQFCGLLLTLICFDTSVVIADRPKDTRKMAKPKHAVKPAKTRYRAVAPKQTLVLRSFVLGNCPNPPSPAYPNNGLIVGCVVGESVPIFSLPKLPTDQNDPCYFHCDKFWSGPSNWLFILDPQGPYPSQGYSPFLGTYGSTDFPMYIVPASGVSRGLAGQVTILAKYTQCVSGSYDTQSSSPL